MKQYYDLKCVLYIFEHEREDYLDWCFHEERDKLNLRGNALYHVWPCAVLSYCGVASAKISLDNVLEELKNEP
jgi:hypothetical protein